MICQNCLKNQSNYHFTKIINGHKTEYHLCESCAREKGDIIQGPGNSFSIHNLLSGMMNLEFGPSGTTTPKITESRCLTCGMSFREFSKRGRFGCSDCYEAFNSHLDPLIRRVQQNNTSHIGKSPSRKEQEQEVKPTVEQQIFQLEKELQEEIRSEHYERAAVLRDRINRLRKRAVAKTWPKFDDAGGGE